MSGRPVPTLLLGRRPDREMAEEGRAGDLEGRLWDLVEPYLAA